MVSLKSAHLYRSVPKDLTSATHTGGAVSLLAIVAIVALLVSNAQSFYAVRVERSMEIDQVYDESMVVSFNITLPRLPCAPNAGPEPPLPLTGDPDLGPDHDHDLVLLRCARLSCPDRRSGHLDPQRHPYATQGSNPGVAEAGSQASLLLTRLRLA